MASERHTDIAQERTVLLDALEAALRTDHRVVAAWLAGSLGRGTADDLSDLDLWLAVDDAFIAAIVADPVGFVHGFTPTILEILAPSNGPPGGAYVLTWVAGDAGPRQVDWYIAPRSSARRSPRTVLLFEHQPMPVDAAPAPLPGSHRDDAIDRTIRDGILTILLTSKHIRRGDAWRAVLHMDHVDNCVMRLQSLIETGIDPAYDDLKRRSRSGDVPGNEAEQWDLLRAMAAHLTDIVERSGRADRFGTTLVAAQQWIPSGR